MIKEERMSDFGFDGRWVKHLDHDIVFHVHRRYSKLSLVRKKGRHFGRSVDACLPYLNLRRNCPVLLA